MAMTTPTTGSKADAAARMGVRHLMARMRGAIGWQAAPRHERKWNRCQGVGSEIL